MKQVKRTTLTRNMQRVLNRFGFTDDGGNTLKEDGVYGDKTKRAVKKFSKYQEELRKPSYATKKWQEGLNNAGYRDSEGKTLKTDGVHGAKTDTATTQFENDFLGTLDKTYQPKTVQKKAFPSAPEYDFGELVGTLKQENGADKILGIQTEPNKFKEIFLKEISKQGGKTKTKNMVYNMNRENTNEVKMLGNTISSQPTQNEEEQQRSTGSIGENKDKTTVGIWNQLLKQMDSEEIWRAQNQETIRKEHWESVKDPIGGINAKLTADQAIEYSKNKYGYQKDGTRQNALQHALWNALMTYQIGEGRAKKFADAHEVLPGSQDKTESNGFSRRENSKMDYYYNELGRKAALELMAQKKRMMPDGSYRIDITLDEMMDFVDKEIEKATSEILNNG